jgi:hypothetical protein
LRRRLPHGAPLNLLGIRTIGDLGRYPVDILKRKFGVTGQHLHDMGLGIDHSPVVPASDQDRVKSVGHSMTLRQDVSRRQDVLKYLLQLSEMVGRRARRYGVSGKTVHLYVRYADFYSSFGKQQTLVSPINQSADIYKAAVDILDTVELQQPVRLLGVRLTNLKYQVAQLPLFPQERRKALMVRAMDAVNNRYGDDTVTFASLMDTEEKGSHVISPAWRPDGIREISSINATARERSRCCGSSSPSQRVATIGSRKTLKAATTSPQRTPVRRTAWPSGRTTPRFLVWPFTNEGLKTVGWMGIGVSRFSNVFSTASASIPALRIGITGEPVGLDRWVVQAGFFRSARQRDVDLVRYLGGDLVKRQCGDQADHAAWGTGCNSHQVRIAHRRAVGKTIYAAAHHL